MRPYDLHFFPYPPLSHLARLLLLDLRVTLLFLGLIRYFYERLGLSRHATVAIGSAGTFNGVFMIGIIAVRLAESPGPGGSPRPEKRAEISPGILTTEGTETTETGSLGVGEGGGMPT